MSTVAPRPASRTVTVALTGEFAGWELTARADFPAAFLADLQSGQMDRIIAVLDTIVVEHNFPTTDGTLAASMGKVDPFDGLLVAGADIFAAIGKLPKR